MALPIPKLGTILGIWAHPDDETFTAAGILSAAAANGQRVVCVTATRGEDGKVSDKKRWPPDKLADIRTQESEAAFRALGLSEHLWLEYPDGQCNQVDTAQAVGQLHKVIVDIKPDTILTFGPEGLTGHPDHMTVSYWATLAAEQTATQLYYAVLDPSQYEHFKPLDQKFNFFFNIAQPPLRPAGDCEIAFQVSHDLVQKKLVAFRTMPSQYESILAELPEKDFQAVFGLECFVKA